MTDTISPKKFPIQKTLSILITCVLSWGFSYLAINVYRDYAFGLFVWLPFFLGAISTLIYSYKNTANRASLLYNSYLTLLIFCVGLFFFSWDGIICLIMAAPIGFVFTYIGFLIAFAIIKGKLKNNTPTAMIILMLSVPSLMAFENRFKDKEDLRTVTTKIEINASPEKVWENVVSFPQLSEPKELVFKVGIAYPINATIKGKGVGAIRSCNFSTGSFIEPITLWNQPKILRFSVDEQPVPMKEISFYSNIQPNHLHGYWISKQGEFKLVPLSNGHTLLIGTTWYVNKIKPNIYWSLWSDYIVHKIHTRVLNHIKLQAER